MTAPSYTTDLTDLDDCTASTNWYEATATGWTSINAETYGDTDDYIHGTSALSSSVKTGVGAVLYNVSGTIPTDGAFLVWIKYSAAGGLYSEASGGIRTLLGDGTASFYAWSHLGNDTYLYDGWLNLATNPSATYDYTEGSYAGSSTVTYWGWGYGATSIPSKGNPFWADMLRYGRCEARFRYGETSDYCTFAGFATQNDSTSNKWGLIQAMPYGYLWKGKMVIGYNSTAADFRDSNEFILLDNTKHVTSGFNAISIETATTNVEWTNITIKSLSTVSPGTLTVTDNPDVAFDKCAFTDMGAHTYQSNSTITDTVFTRCGLVTTGGGTFTGCTFEDTDDSTKAVVASSPANAALVSNCTFVSGGTGHGLEVGGTAADFTLTGCTFTGYDTADPGTAANKAIYVNIASGTVNLTISGGSGVTADHHVRTAGATVNVLTGSVTLTVTCVKTDGTALQNVRVFVKAKDGTGPFPFEDTVTIANSGTTATVTHTAHGMESNDYVFIDGASHHQNNGVFQITVTNANTYTYTMASAPGSSPTGTIESTFVALYGLSDANGEVTASRVYASDQPITGWARNTVSGSPYYQEGVVTGSVDAADGLTTTAVLVGDE
jgi:hypothetical protein